MLKEDAPKQDFARGQRGCKVESLHRSRGTDAGLLGRSWWHNSTPPRQQGSLHGRLQAMHSTTAPLAVGHAGTGAKGKPAHAHSALPAHLEHCGGQRERGQD